MNQKKLYTTDEADVGYRFAPEVRTYINGDWEGLKITNYQIVGEHSAKRIQSVISDNTVLEVCTGIGATTFILAQTFSNVIAVDNSIDRLDITKKNLQRLNLSHKVEFVHGDILDPDIISMLSKKGIKAAYTDVDWKKGNDWTDWVTDINTTGPSTSSLYEVLSEKITNNICMKLPKTINLDQLRELGECEIEEIKPNNKVCFYLVYFGNLVRDRRSKFTFNKRHYDEVK